MNFIEWVLFGIPWWVHVALTSILVAGGFVVASMIFGFERVRRWIIPAIILVVTLGAINKFRQEGWEAKAKRDLREADKLIERARKARERADKENADPERMREDDGFRRD